MIELEELQCKQMELYKLYLDRVLSLEEYLILMSGLDRRITELELRFLPDTFLCRRASG